MKLIKAIIFMVVFSCVILPQNGGSVELRKGAVIRTDKTKKEIHLVFTGHHFADGGLFIRGVFKKLGDVKAAFFLTGDFYRNPDFAETIKELKKAGHYLGSHSDKHLLYAPWENEDSTIITKEEFLLDIENSYAELAKFGITKKEAPFFLPPFEWYNDTIAAWTKEAGLTLINYSPGTRSNQDYTLPSMGKDYTNSDIIFDSIIKYENENKDGLNGFILLTHIGTEPERTDKFYYKLEKLITELKSKGYIFTLLK